MRPTAAVCVAIAIGAVSCRTESNPPDASSSAPSSRSSSSSVALPADPPTVSAAPPLGTSFGRTPQHFNKGDAVDGCTHFGGSFVGCYVNYQNETDPTMKRYLRRIAMGLSDGNNSYEVSGTPDVPGAIPHAEVPGGCDPTKPCGAMRDGTEINSALQCLARVHEALTLHQVAAAKAAHRHACKCHPEDAEVPAYLTSGAICDSAGRPSFIGAGKSKDELADIVACASCDADRGPAACVREVERLSKSDPELSSLITEKQVPRCRTLFQEAR